MAWQVHGLVRRQVDSLSLLSVNDGHTCRPGRTAGSSPWCLTDDRVGRIRCTGRDVIKVIPAQRVADLALQAGLADASGWCPVDHLTWDSTLLPDFHVIGDAVVQAPLPKSGFAVNSEAKVCAANVVQLRRGEMPVTPYWINTCYSLITPGPGIAGAYKLVDGRAVAGAGGLSAADAPGARTLEAAYAVDWYRNITCDMSG
jgi:sulfide dehydrogenase [flavocytochrome c] flavoprotein subunit